LNAPKRNARKSKPKRIAVFGKPQICSQIHTLRSKIPSLLALSEKGRNCETNPIFNTNHYQSMRYAANPDQSNPRNEKKDGLFFEGLATKIAENQM
jgi:hypothetical protein